ncbi:uncharacterized protein EDB91DRAFT_1089156 [Suillus paluster]|uniref:uncharacterized protein n=1 Tax=Suillus paluster TaxID=48578 RepID=UPI001B878310|nr:uncharacterized protein EDB91DRAFT_1089156 [Suillus paluster]KAG1719703.1 hypothetical protein EDB91DRAFT_1089156 [Suillus paluster]
MTVGIEADGSAVLFQKSPKAPPHYTAASCPILEVVRDDAFHSSPVDWANTKAKGELGLSYGHIPDNPDGPSSVSLHKPLMPSQISTSNTLSFALQPGARIIDYSLTRVPSLPSIVIDDSKWHVSTYSSLAGALDEWKNGMITHMRMGNTPGIPKGGWVVSNVREALSAHGALDEA